MEKLKSPNLANLKSLITRTIVWLLAVLSLSTSYLPYLVGIENQESFSVIKNMEENEERNESSNSEKEEGENKLAEFLVWEDIYISTSRTADSNPDRFRDDNYLNISLNILTPPPEV